jgi:ATP-dependent DNA helicase RecG
MTSNENNALLGRLREDIQKWEGQDLEFMQEFPDNVRELAKEITAFATSNAGTIYIGVDNDGKIVGAKGISSLTDINGKDEYNKRIQGISQSIDPPIRVGVLFIGDEERVVMRIDVPKGSEPVYYVGGIPYLRDITASRPARATEVKETYQRYFQATRAPPPDPQQNFLRRLIEQFSDIRLLLYDYRDHLIRPDINQMLYDLGASGRILLRMSSETPSKELGVEEQLVRISERLEDLESHTFYIGNKSVDEFGEKAKSCMDLVTILLNQVMKHAKQGPMTDYVELVIRNIESLRKEWERRERYLERGEMQRLREGFRRYAFVFYRFGNFPESGGLANVGQNLRMLGERLRNLSSVQKYFSYGLGMNPLTKIDPSFSECSQLMDSIVSDIRHSRPT